MANIGQRLGITEPISLGGPTDYDTQKTQELEKVVFFISKSVVNLYNCSIHFGFKNELGFLFLFFGVSVFARCKIV